MQIDLAATLCLPFIVLLTIHSSVWNVRSFELKKKGGGMKWAQVEKQLEGEAGGRKINGE